jgi:serine/threonine protein phosphatase PrpC
LGSFVAVYDGHGGTVSADYAVKHAHKNILSCHRAKVDMQRGTPTDSTIEAALTEGFEVTDRECLNINRRKDIKDGSTAVACLIYGHGREEMQGKLKIFCANLGDSRALLCRGGKAVRLIVCVCLCARGRACAYELNVQGIGAHTCVAETL